MSEKIVFRGRERRFDIHDLAECLSEASSRIIDLERENARLKKDLDWHRERLSKDLQDAKRVVVDTLMDISKGAKRWQ